MDGTDRIGCLTSVLDLSVQLRGGISRRFLPRIFLFPVFLLLPPFVSSRRERGKGKGEVLRGHERFYVKLEEISVTRNFVCMMRDVFFFLLLLLAR